jgi:DNA primase
MALYPRSFVEDLRNHADIVAVIQDYVTLRKVGNTFKGLCPFHNEKTPSFNVNRDKGFFHCFGCNTSGDVFKFLELHDKVGFGDAVKLVAQRFGLSLPEPEQTEEQRASSVERETLLKVHEAASAWFASQLTTAAGARVRKHLADRAVSEATWNALALGFAPPGRDGLRTALSKQGFSDAVLLRAGLLVQRDDGIAQDRFRNRLMIPIARDSGSVIAFGGRALEDGQGPKYLNSPETPIYSKGRTLYGLHLSKAAIRQQGFAVLVEGYFDFAQLYQGGFQGVIASCGTALTIEQARQLKRFTEKVVLSYDPDTAGQTAAARSSELLVAEGFRVSVAILDAGEDPDLFIRRHGPHGYRQRLAGAQPYLEYLLDRAAARHDLNGDEGRVRFLAEMIPIAARIPDAPTRDRFVDRLAHRSFVTVEVVRGEIRKVLGSQPGSARLSETPVRTELPAFGRMTKAEKALIWWLINRPDTAWPALDGLEIEDFAGLASRSVLDLARKLNEDSGFSPHVLVQQLSAVEAHLVTTIAAEPEPPALGLRSCVQEIQRTRHVRARAEVQREIERLQSGGASESPEMDALLTRLGELGRVIQALVLSEE